MNTPAHSVIGMLIPDGTNQFFSQLAQLVQRELQGTSRAVVTMDSDGSVRKELHLLKTLREMEVEAIVFVSVGDSVGAYRYLREWEIPVLILDREIPDMENADFVVARNSEGVDHVVEHLETLGHRQVGFIKGAENTEPGRIRAEAFMHACARTGLEIPPHLVFAGNFQFDAGRDAGDQIAAMPQSKRPTAVFAANDLMAIGLVQRLQELSIGVPEEISVIGFDDIPLASWVYPQLTSIQQDVYEMAHVGVRLLEERLSGAATGEAPASRIRPIQPRLVIRESCGPVMVSPQALETPSERG